MKIKEEPSDNAAPSDTGHSDHDASTLDVSVRADSSSTDAGMSLEQDSNVITQPSDTSTCDGSSQQLSAQKDVTPTSSSANVTATTMTADEDGQIAANVTESTASPVPDSDNLADAIADATALPSPGTSVATLPGIARTENMEDSVDKVDSSEDRAGNDTIAAQVINKT